MWRYIVAYVIGVGALVAALTHAWYGAGKAEQRRAALQEVNRY